MDAIKVTIEILESEMSDLTCKVDSFSKYGRSPNDEDYMQMIQMLSMWLLKKEQASVLKNVLKAIESNKETYGK